MSTKQVLSLFLILSVAILVGCKGKNWMNGGNDADSIALKPATPQADSAINRALRFYAGISADGINMSPADAQGWEENSEEVKKYVEESMPTRQMVEDIAKEDFKDFRDAIDFVFYPFSGADFIFPHTIFPNADIYFLLGTESIGNPIGSKINTSFASYESYRNALATYFNFNHSLPTEDLNDAIDSEAADGTCPVITMLMALCDQQIVSIKFKDFDRTGNIIDAKQKQSNLIEIKFFRAGSKHEQTLYYFSGNVTDDRFPNPLQIYLDRNLKQHKVATYLKAASFLMHSSTFSFLRNHILNNSLAVIEDDSGIPYRHFANNFDVTLYGVYKKPSKELPPSWYQPDLEALYKERHDSIKALPYRIGYTSPSNLLVARKKKSQPAPTKAVPPSTAEGKKK